MKSHFFFLPAVVLTCGWFFLHRQHAEISSLEQETSRLEQAVKLAQQAPTDRAAGARSSRASDPSLTKKNSRQLDWKKIGLLRSEGKRGSETQQLRLDAELTSALLAMPLEDLTAQLQEIDSLDLPEANKNELLNRLLDAMADRDPALAVRSFASRIDNENSTAHSIFSSAFDKWMSADLTSAMAWLDASVKEGIFKSKALGGQNVILNTLQSSAISSLVESNPEAAKQRTLSIPERNREDMLTFVIDRMKPDAEKDIVDIIRSSLPPGKRADVLGHAANRAYLAGGFEKIEGLLMQSTGITTEERNTVVVRAAIASMPQSGKTEAITPALEAAREWAIKVAPGTENEVIGKVLAHRGAYDDFNAAAQIAVGFGNDGVLSAFLESPYAASHREEAQALLEKISDPAVREQLRVHLSEDAGH